jgi:hypothetical protein
MSSDRVKNRWKHYDHHNNVNGINNENESRIIVKKGASPFARTLATLRFVHFSDKSVKVYYIRDIYY